MAQFLKFTKRQFSGVVDSIRQSCSIKPLHHHAIVAFVTHWEPHSRHKETCDDIRMSTLRECLCVLHCGCDRSLLRLDDLDRYLSIERLLSRLPDQTITT